MAKNTNQQREDQITAALSTPEGKAALRAAMSAPIQTSIMYQNIGAKLLMVDSLPDPYDEYPNARDAVSDYMKKWVQK